MSTGNQVINDIEPRTQAIAIADQTVFNTDWTADATTDINVYSRGSDVEADDQTQLVSQNDYNVEFIGTYETVRITFLVGRTVGDIVTIARNTPSDRENLYTNTNFTPSMLNQDFGILTLVDQQNIMYDQDLCPHYNVSCSYTDPSDLAIDLILPILDANQFWVKNGANTAIIAADLPSGGGSLPNTSPFVIYKADPLLINAFDLGTLTSGILAQNVSSDIAIPFSVDFSPSAVLATNSGSVPSFTQALPAEVQVSVGSLNHGTNASASTFWRGDGTWVAGTGFNAITAQQITATGAFTYTPTAGTRYAIFELQGGGGGSGGTGGGASQGSVGAAGGGGAYQRIIVTGTANLAAITGSVGSGGTAGTNAPGNGGAGGNTTLVINGGSTWTSSGGAGGLGQTASGGGQTNPGGLGGTNSSGTNGMLGAQIPGGQGALGFVAQLASVTCPGPAGGSSFLSTPGMGALTIQSVAATASLYGGGAGGDVNGIGSNSVGFAGAQGIVIVTEFQ